eukprot:CAMPEP_0202424194 /NCGR_PEP_ID=MMETSP1128-20130828/51775_1 /ASSEMBLY_ACC=CAM_ASM_000463 /TAXON_ID=3047 /ORGANISM="Dunaliella tertiolecta, Strain CCMP1320" /LENGTH=103 /DNA_ID=CAMNT_0049032337 /DNA_START=652 /DNA_END=959 /DNA_ORIENTATION=-
MPLQEQLSLVEQAHDYMTSGRKHPNPAAHKWMVSMFNTVIRDQRPPGEVETACSVAASRPELLYLDQHHIREQWEQDQTMAEANPDPAVPQQPQTDSAALKQP